MIHLALSSYSYTMRTFQIILEVIWILLGFVCIYLGVRTRGIEGSNSNIFFLLAAIAFGMGIFRIISRRNREKRN